MSENNDLLKQLINTSNNAEREKILLQMSQTDISQTQQHELTSDMRQLAFLAHQMQRVESTAFNIEDLQPDWIPTGRLNQRYHWWVGLMLGLIVGLIGFLFGGPVDQLPWDELEWESARWVIGLALGVVLGLAGGGGAWLSRYLYTQYPHKNRIFSGLILTTLIFGLICWLGTWSIAVLFQPEALEGLFGNSNWPFLEWIDDKIVKTQAGPIDQHISNLVGSLVLGLFYWLGFTVAGGLIVGLGGFVSLGLLHATADQVEFKNKLKLKWPTMERWLAYVRRFGRWGLILGAIGIGSVGPIVAWWLTALARPRGGALRSSELFYFFLLGMMFLLILGLIGGLVGTTLSIFDMSQVDEQFAPGIRIRHSLQSGLLLTSIVGIVFVLINWLDLPLFLNLISFALWSTWSLPIIFTVFGGMAWCQHWALRFVLYWHSYLPFRLVPWLNRMVDIGLLRQVGAGYIFSHRTLLEYFADQEPHS